jgi:hypothetical protein
VAAEHSGGAAKPELPGGEDEELQRQRRRRDPISRAAMIPIGFPTRAAAQPGDDAAAIFSDARCRLNGGDGVSGRPRVGREPVMDEAARDRAATGSTGGRSGGDRQHRRAGVAAARRSRQCGAPPLLPSLFFGSK